MSIKININGLDELQRKLKQMPHEIERIRLDVLSKYASKIKKEATDACPTQEMKDSVKLTVKSDGAFSISCSEEAKQYVDPIVEKNKRELHHELESKITAAWRS